MRRLLFALAAMMLPLQCKAISQNEIRYYVGTSASSRPTGEQNPSERTAVKKVVSQANGRIIEIACIVDGEGRHRNSAAYMAIDRNRITVSDNENMQSKLFEGTGFALGTPWNWKYFVLDLKTKFGGRATWIHDTNVFTRARIYSIKIIYPNVGTNEDPIRGPDPALFLTMRLQQVSRTAYHREIATLGCEPN